MKILLLLLCCLTAAVSLAQTPADTLHLIGDQGGFRCVAAMPDPAIVLSTMNNSDNVSEAEFKKVQGLIPVLHDFDFDVRFKMVGFRLTRIAANGERQTLENQ